jgi:hypothetical protein
MATSGFFLVTSATTLKTELLSLRCFRTYLHEYGQWKIKVKKRKIFMSDKLFAKFFCCQNRNYVHSLKVP